MYFFAKAYYMFWFRVSLSNRCQTRLLSERHRAINCGSLPDEHQLNFSTVLNFGLFVPKSGTIINASRQQLQVGFDSFIARTNAFLRLAIPFKVYHLTLFGCFCSYSTISPAYSQWSKPFLSIKTAQNDQKCVTHENSLVVLN